MTTTTPQLSVELEAAYDLCREVAVGHGRTYYLATRLLPADRRPGFHSLYAFARTIDDLVDVEAGSSRTWEECARELDRIEAQLHELITADDPRTVELDPNWRPTLLAFADTMARYDVDPDHVWGFLGAMRMDLPGTERFRTRYTTMAELREYMEASAATIGMQLLAVLGAVVPLEVARPRAAALGQAFQLTNFIRDVGEDLQRGRLYLPADELAVFGVDYDLLLHCQRTATTDRRVRNALAHFAAVNRSIYRTARPGIDMLDPQVRPAMRAAYTLYADILDQIEKADFRVLDRRAVVPRSRRFAVAAPEFARALAARRLG